MFGTKNVKERELIDIFLLKTQGLQLDGRLDIPVLDQPVKVKGQDIMSRKFYVDAVNGSDLNNGSQTAPFKTLKKAVDSVPVGGKGRINAKGDILIEEDIDITGKYIELHAEEYDTTNNAPTQIFQNSSAATDARIRVGFGVGYFHIEGFSIIANKSNNQYPHWSTLFKCNYGAFFLQIGRWDRPSNLEVNHTLFDIESGFGFLHFRNFTISSNSSTAINMTTLSDGAKLLYQESIIIDNSAGLVSRPVIGLN